MANYYANACSKVTFGHLGHLLYHKLRAWAYLVVILTRADIGLL